jgi:hypothetical protein
MIGTVKIIETYYLLDDVVDGDYPRDDTMTTEYPVDTVDEAVELIRREGLSFDATGTDWAAQPDGSAVVNYATGQQVEVTAHLNGFTDADVEAIMEGTS